MPSYGPNTGSFSAAFQCDLWSGLWPSSVTFGQGFGSVTFGQGFVGQGFGQGFWGFGGQGFGEGFSGFGLPV